MSIGEPIRIPLSGNSLPEAVAHFLVERHASELPDLSGLIILVPNHRAGQDFARCLARLNDAPLIPPRILPLKAWAEEHATGSTEAVSRRLCRLHAQLRKQSWLGFIDKWALADELLRLSDALAAARPDARPDFARTQAPNREVALVEAVFTAFNGNASDPVTRYAEALNSLLGTARSPLYCFAPGPLTRLETRFLEQYAGRAPVTLLELAPDTPVSQCLHVAWTGSSPPIRDRARNLAAKHPVSPLLSRIMLGPAPHLEAEARMAAGWVTEQIRAGHQRIALIALDRLTARRVRALLDRLDVLIEDETGWTFSTTSAAAIIDRWLECLASDFPHVELLDLLKSPFLLGDPVARQDAVLRLELAMRKRGISQGRANLWTLVQTEAGLADAQPLLSTLLGAAQDFSMRRTSLSDWLGRLQQSLIAIQAFEPLAADAAGVQLLEKLDTLRAELADDTEIHSFGEWRRWLDWILESATFSDMRVSSPVVLTSLPNARGRVFDAVAILGADAAHLPAPPATGLFNQSVICALGLPNQAEHLAQTREDLIQLLSQGQTLLTWQAWKDDEPNPPSPFISLLQTLHRAAWGLGLREQPPARPPAQADGLPIVPVQPAPDVDAGRLPLRYSATTYQALLDCPYRFFARTVLGLKELDEADQEFDKSDYGNALHRILLKFHDSSPPREEEAAGEKLHALSEAEFSTLPAWTAASWRARWLPHQTGYIALWLQHEAEGWRYQAGEQPFQQITKVAGLGEVTLYGRADRVDARGDDRRVLDYKTTSPDKLKKRVKAPDEHIQLPFYAWLAQAEAAFLPIDTDKAGLVALEGETDCISISLRLPALLENIAAGAALIANGAEDVCQYCEARGLCRKGLWHD